jgi:hypothetical protein
MAENTDGLPQRIYTLFQLMFKNPECLSHLILVGPPGSGKTTSARYFVEKLHGAGGFSSFFGRALFLNSSDERGLEAVRSRVFPFVRSSLHSMLQIEGAAQKPKIIIFDEAETLTDQAQMALRPLLDKKPQEVLLIFLCNSVSRIHPSILHKFLTIQLESPSTKEFVTRLEKIQASIQTKISGIDILFRRGDIRFFLLHPKKNQECAEIWNQLLSTPSYKLRPTVEQILEKWIYPEFGMFLLFLSKELCVLTPEALFEMLRITDSDFLRLCPYSVQVELVTSWIQTHFLQKLEATAA